MKIRNLFISGVCLLAVLFTSCDHDLDLTADYKNITFTYAILNQNDSIHYFKIYKGFLTDDNAYVAASGWENIYYPVDSIEVRLEEISESGRLLRTAVLDTTTQVDKTNGYFAHPKQLLYYSNWKLSTNNTYKLVVKNVNNGKEVYAVTPIVGNFSLRNPQQTWNMNLENPYTIRFYAAEHSAAYDLYMSFYFIEVNRTTGEIKHKVLTKKLNSDFIRSTTTNEVSFVGFVPKTFYEYIAQNIQADDNIDRYIDAINGKPYSCIRLTLWAADKTFLNYYNVSHPNTSVVQNRLEYTNFISEDETAYGILASRNSCHRDLQFNSLEHNEDTLVKGQMTKHLNFNYYRNSPLFPSEP